MRGTPRGTPNIYIFIRRVRKRWQRVRIMRCDIPCSAAVQQVICSEINRWRNTPPPAHDAAQRKLSPSFHYCRDTRGRYCSGSSQIRRLETRVRTMDVSGGRGNSNMTCVTVKITSTRCVVFAMFESDARGYTTVSGQPSNNNNL